jgi:hypothetical protein
MARTNSKGSRSARSGPFLQTSAMPPLLTNVRQDNPVIEAWSKHQEQPLSSYTFSHQPQRSTSQRKSNLEHVPELENVGEDPAAFLSREGFAPTFSYTPAQLSIPSPTTPSRARMSSINTHQTYNMYTPTTPTSDSQSLTTATTLTSNTMSRQNSLYNEPILESIEMMKFNSNTSFSTDYPTDQNMYDQVTPHSTSSRHSRRSSNEEQSQLLVGAGGAGNDSHFSRTFSSQEKYPQFQSSGSFGEKMEKSQSNESTSSTSSSLSSRSKQSLRASIELAASRRLMPKGISEGHPMSRDNSSQSMVRLESRNGSQDKIAISKPTYQRPRHDRVQCTQCDDHPDGFRGEHELRRHQDRQHKTRVKKWVCMMPTSNSELQSALKPALPLSRCKSCQQRKEYGAYYNAAAHLRRAHFKPKSKGRSKSHAKLETPQKRGGNGGGDWPKMEDLKPWMIEVEVDVVPTEFNLAAAQQEEADDASDDDNCDNFLDESPATNNIPNISGGGFENPYIITDNTFAVYPSPTNNDMFNIQNMPYLDLPRQNIDSSMNCSQTTFDTFPSYSNDHLAFEPSSISLSQPFDDQLLSNIDPVYSFPPSSLV